MTARRIVRDRQLTAEEAARYDEVRAQVTAEVPDLVARHAERMVARDEVVALVRELRAAREARGLSLADMRWLTGMDRSAISKLENGQRPNPTIETLARYADAVGKRLVVTLADA